MGMAMRCRAWCGALLSGLGLQLAGVAHAGPIENMRQVALKPGDPDTLVVGYENGRDGLLYTHDAGKHWHLACTTAIDPALAKVGALLIAGDGAALMGADDGLWQDDGTGCGWSKQATLEGHWVSQLVAHPSDSEVAFAMVSVGADTTEELIYRRDATGAWSEVGPREAIFVSEFRVGETAAGLRFYESAVAGTTTTTVGGMDMEVANYVIRVSDDEAKTWKEHPIAVSDGSPRLQAIDPSNPDRIVATIEREGADDSVMVSADQGASFTEYMKVGEFGGLVFAADGRLWIGDMGGGTSQGATTGLWFAPSLGVPAQRLADFGVRCVAHDPATDKLFVCQRFSFGSVAADGTFTSLLSFTKVDGFVDCPGTDQAALCEVQLCTAFCGQAHFAIAPVCSAYDQPTCGPCADDPSGAACLDRSVDAGLPAPTTDAGAAPGKADAGAAPAGKSSTGGCVCVTAGAPTSRTLVPTLAALGLPLLGARRRSRAGLHRIRRR
jgi:hypothetical protein